MMTMMEMVRRESEGNNSAFLLSFVISLFLLRTHINDVNVDIDFDVDAKKY